MHHTRNRIQNWFWRSETILWARLQILFGVIWGVLSVSDLSPLLSGKWLTIWLIFNGVVSELLRRRGAVQTTVMVPEITQGALDVVPKAFLATPPPQEIKSCG